MTNKPEFQLTRPNLATKNCDYLGLSFESQAKISSFKKLFPDYEEALKKGFAYSGTEIYTGKSGKRSHILSLGVQDMRPADKDSISFTVTLSVMVFEKPIDFKKPPKRSTIRFNDLLAMLQQKQQTYVMKTSASFTYPKQEDMHMGLPIDIRSGTSSFEIAGMRIRVRDPQKGNFAIIVDTQLSGETWHNISFEPELELSKRLLVQAVTLVSKISKDFAPKPGGTHG